MWSLALASLRFRWLSFVGVFVTVVAAAALVTATGSLLEGGIRGWRPARAPRRRRHRRRRRPDIVPTTGRGDDRETVSSTVVERVRLPADLAAKVSSRPGVAQVVADVSFPAYVVVDRDPVSGPRRDSRRSATRGPVRRHAVRLADGIGPGWRGRRRDRLRAGAPVRPRGRRSTPAVVAAAPSR